MALHGWPAAIAAVALVTLVPAPGAMASSPAASHNTFVRSCSTITFRCTAYDQTNPPYDGLYPSTYTTNWAWVWI